MSIAGLLGALYVYVTMHVFGFPFFFAFHPSAVSFAALPCCRLPSWTAALQSVAGEMLGRASTLALLDYSEVFGKPASRLF